MEKNTNIKNITEEPQENKITVKHVYKTHDNKSKKYHINHENTNNKEIGVTLHKKISSILDIPITETNLNNYININGLNQIFKNQNKKTPKKAKITFHIKNLKIEIYNNKDIIITQKHIKN